MGFLRFLVWTTMCIGLGLFAAGWEIDGRTPVQHLRQIWKGAPSSVAPVVDKVKHLAAPVTAAAPTETHTDADRDAVNRLVAKRAATK